MANPCITQTLQQYFGFDQLRLGQQPVIEHILAGHSAAAIFPTGSGKSLCYQLPALMLPHLTLVISPLLALIHDQLQFLQSKGIAAACIDSSQDYATSQSIMRRVQQGEIKILMISVERLKNERFRQFISQVPISMMVVDEAHCISEWGHNFRPDYLKLPHYCQQLNIGQVLLLTATATEQVIADMQQKFAIAPEHVTVTGFYRPNLDLAVLPCTPSQKVPTLIEQLKTAPEAPTIVYVTLQHSAEQVAAQLMQAGINAKAYHAGLDHTLRQNIQQQFMAGQIHCIVATIAFGMGVDKSDIRRVIHFDLPKSIENYSQEIGRAGRDGLPSQCMVLANCDGVHVLENFVYGDTPELSAIQSVLNEIHSQSSPQWELQLLSLSKRSNIRQLPLKTLLVYLELQGVIEAQYSYFADYKFKWVHSREQILSQFQGERQDFIRAIFACSPQARTWCQVDFEALWQGGQHERKRVIAALDYFHQQGWIVLESKQMTDVYRIRQGQFEPQKLAQQLHQLFAQKEQSEMARIAAMLDFFQAHSCLSARLARYFADHQAPEQCGHCSVCRGQVAQLAQSEQAMPTIATLEHWLTPLRLADATSPFEQPLSKQAATRFLCGISTPRLSQLKANKMDGFAKLEQQPFAQVFAALSQLTSPLPD
ncbi:RecQ family ATP-dependent DNA helicase [Vibrio stylophorae]|uniref:RecQ family ATP-dependent DNA helicase n=1 Tax=Vibrio stylophorae TaxID=659351 RepID=UPI001EFFD4C9|nr:RecQ family ATP-dependent DNA helicase [Vibrio stylophorae]